MELVLGATGHPGVPERRLLAGVVRRIGYEAVNVTGCVLCTFENLEHAKTWTKDRSVVHDGLHVIEVVETARVAYRPKVRRAA